MSEEKDGSDEETPEYMPKISKGMSDMSAELK